MERLLTILLVVPVVAQVLNLRQLPGRAAVVEDRVDSPLMHRAHLPEEMQGLMAVAAVDVVIAVAQPAPL